MADGTLTRIAVTRWRVLPAAARVAVIYVLARAVTVGYFAAASALSTASSRYGLHPGVGHLLVQWDAQWYWYIAVHGYPTTLPLDDAGNVTQNQWAFMPVYPMLVRLLGGTGAGWTVAAVVVSVTAGYVAALLLHVLLRRRLGETTALWAVLFFCIAPVSAVLQTGYAEGLFLVWLLAALWAVDRRRYAWLYPLVPLMGFTRPGVLAFALFLGCHGVVRWVRRRREALTSAHVVHIVVNGIWAAVVGLSWPVIAAVATGQRDAYMATELSWRRGWIPGADGSFTPFADFWHAAQVWFGIWGLPPAAGPVALVVLVVVVAGVLLFDPRVRRLGSDVRLWSGAYLLYLLAVFFPQSSIFRLLMPLAPLWGAVAQPRSRWWRAGVVVFCLVGQWWWVWAMYAQGTALWQIP